MLILACAVLLALFVLFTASLTISILVGLLTGSLAAITLEGARELGRRLRRRWGARLKPPLLRKILQLGAVLGLEPSPKR